jgi:DNA-binding NtrC family response regulator
MSTEKEIVTKPLVLIDDDLVSHVVFNALMKIHHGLIPVESFLKAREALDSITNKSIEPLAIILDINMPVMTGWQFLEQFEKTTFDTPVYMLSSSSDIKDRMNAAKFKNVAGYFVKPLRITDLARILKEVHK